MRTSCNHLWGNLAAFDIFEPILWESVIHVQFLFRHIIIKYPSVVSLILRLIVYMPCYLWRYQRFFPSNSSYVALIRLVIITHEHVGLIHHHRLMRGRCVANDTRNILFHGSCRRRKNVRWQPIPCPLIGLSRAGDTKLRSDTSSSYLRGPKSILCLRGVNQDSVRSPLLIVFVGVLLHHLSDLRFYKIIQELICHVYCVFFKPICDIYRLLNGSISGFPDCTGHHSLVDMVR
jgi:hypothetical protein